MEDRIAVLEAIERGDISVEQGLSRLEDPGEQGGTPQGPPILAPPVVRPLLIRIIWQSVFWGGVALLVAASILVSASYAWTIAPAWRTVGWVVLGLGVVAAMVGWWMRTARWLSIRIREAEGTNLTLAFPVPLHLVYWALRLSRAFVPKLRDVPVEETVAALAETLRDGDPFFVDVQDDEDGDHVQVYFA